MKKYVLTLNIGLTSHIDADRWVKEENAVRFMRGGREVATYYIGTIRKIEDCTKGVPCKPEYVGEGLPYVRE
jgi:hypothetical protein